MVGVTFGYFAGQRGLAEEDWVSFALSTAATQSPVDESQDFVWMREPTKVVAVLEVCWRSPSSREVASEQCRDCWLKCLSRTDNCEGLVLPRVFVLCTFAGNVLGRRVVLRSPHYFNLRVFHPKHELRDARIQRDYLLTVD